MIAIPIAITIIAFLIAFTCMPKMEDNHNSAFAGVGMAVEGFIGLFFLAIATIASLVSWLVYLGVK